MGEHHSCFTELTQRHLLNQPLSTLPLHIARLRHFIFLHLSSTHQNQDPHTAAMPATTAETLSLVNRTVSVAPLVLLSATDHYARSAKGTKKRVVGVLLGQNDGKNVRVSNSFAGKYYGDAPMPRCHF